MSMKDELDRAGDYIGDMRTSVGFAHDCHDSDSGTCTYNRSANKAVKRWHGIRTNWFCY